MSSILFLTILIFIALVDGELLKRDEPDPITGRTEEMDQRIIEGEITDISNYPHLCAFHIEKQFACGANIISDQYGLTAGHCVFQQNVSKISLLCGTSISVYGGYRVYIKNYTIHQNYNDKTFDNDIALLLTTEPFRWPARPIKLETREVVTGDAFICGWGVTEDGCTSDYLKDAVVNVIHDQDCKSLYPKEVTNNMICAGWIDAVPTVCNGDSGGSLVTYYQGEYHLTGIVSWGYSCAVRFYPAIFTKVFNYVSWIREICDNCC